MEGYELLILALDAAGLPSRWLPVEEAITYHARRMVAWCTGPVVATYRGGICRASGERSRLSTTSIIAIRGPRGGAEPWMEPRLTNDSLFARDRHLCAYCGHAFRERELSRDHVLPVHRGGVDRWMNVVTACRVCNIRKGGRTPEGAGMPLLYAPYVPNRHEHLILQNRRILDDQMAFLAQGVPRSSRLHAGAVQ